MKKINMYVSKYFLVTNNCLKNKNQKSIIKFFSFNNETVVCGIEIIKKIIKKNLKRKDYNSLSIWSKKDGDIVNKHEPIIIIEGDYRKFSFLENIIDGILVRMCSVATNSRNVIKAANGKEIIFMADRSDMYFNQEYDGYAAYVGGIRSFVTKAHLNLIPNKDKCKYVGTMPHSLIHQCNGDLIQALELLIENNKNIAPVALIDFYNDCCEEIKKIANSNLKNKIYAVRIDTSKSLVDKSLQNNINWKNNEKYYGVNEYLVNNVRQKLDNNKMEKIKIIVTSNIDLEKIIYFEKINSPIDIYGIGGYLINNKISIAADLIKLNDKYFSKFGRESNVENFKKNHSKW